MTTEEIEAFVAICEAKSISKAAEQLFISQPSLSTKLKTLEQETAARCWPGERDSGSFP